MYLYKMPIFVAQQKIPLTSNKPTDMVREYERKQKIAVMLEISPMHQQCYKHVYSLIPRHCPVFDCLITGGVEGLGTKLTSSYVLKYNCYLGIN